MSAPFGIVPQQQPSTRRRYPVVPQQQQQQQQSYNYPQQPVYAQQDGYSLPLPGAHYAAGNNGFKSGGSGMSRSDSAVGLTESAVSSAPGSPNKAAYAGYGQQQWTTYPSAHHQQYSYGSSTGGMYQPPVQEQQPKQGPAVVGVVTDALKTVGDSASSLFTKVWRMRPGATSASTASERFV
ncbi:hypothetical protein RI367_007912 [Sorochytrium milnesiophthora]